MSKSKKTIAINESDFAPENLPEIKEAINESDFAPDKLKECLAKWLNIHKHLFD